VVADQVPGIEVGGDVVGGVLSPEIGRQRRRAVGGVRPQHDLAYVGGGERAAVVDLYEDVGRPHRRLLVPDVLVELDPVDELVGPDQRRPRPVHLDIGGDGRRHARRHACERVRAARRRAHGAVVEEASCARRC